MTRKWPVTGVLLAVLWLFIRGVGPAGSAEATLRAVGGEFLIGLAVGLPVAYALRRFYADQLTLVGGLRSIPAAVAYLSSFLYELLTANLDVAYRVLAPSQPIDPVVVAVPLRVQSDAAIATIANSISLTPGTLTMDHDEPSNTLYVHAIAASDPAELLGPIRRWEDYALVIFEGRDPDDADVPTRGQTGDPQGTVASTGEAGAGGGEQHGR